MRNMKLFLTSSPCDDNVPEGADLPCILNEANGFVEKLKERWKPHSQFLIVSSDPDFFERNDEMLDTFRRAFCFHGMEPENMAILDSRNEQDAAKYVAMSDFILLAGGHVPTENAFFERIGLKNLLEDFEGIVMGVSAGTMNSAGTVYAQPEEEGESVDPEYQRFIPGLDLTDVMVLPHYQKVKDYWLDGKRLFEDITYPDSFGRKFYALVDGSFILAEQGRTVLYGEAYRIQDGECVQICRDGGEVEL